VWQVIDDEAGAAFECSKGKAVVAGDVNELECTAIVNRQQASTRRQQMTTRWWWQAAIAARVVELGLSTRGET
jgi:hypothetical protein